MENLKKELQNKTLLSCEGVLDWDRPSAGIAEDPAFHGTQIGQTFRSYYIPSRSFSLLHAFDTGNNWSSQSRVKQFRLQKSATKVYDLRTTICGRSFTINKDKSRIRGAFNVSHRKSPMQWYFSPKTLNWRVAFRSVLKSSERSQGLNLDSSFWKLISD